MNADTMIHRYERLIVGALLAASLILRVVWWDLVPPGVRFDELVNVKMMDHIYAGEWPIYFQEAWGHEPLYHYLQAAAMWLLGTNPLGVRAASILFGTLGILTTYVVFRRLYGLQVALVTAALLATSLWSLVYSRFGDRHISLTVWVGLAAYGFWQGLEAPPTKRLQGMLWFALGGAAMGAGLLTYFASRVVPILFIAFTLYLFVFHRPMLRGRWLGLILFFLLAVLLVAPMALYLRQHPELESRLGQVGGQLLAALRAGDVQPLANSVLRTLGMFGVTGDPEWLYNISGRPVFDPFLAILFYAGVLLSLWRWRDPKQAFALLWLAAGIGPTILSWPPGSLGHSIVAQPVAFVFPTLALYAAYRWLAQGEHRTLNTRWVRRGGLVAATIIVLFSSALNIYDYFVRWPHFPHVRHEYQAPITAVARYLQEHPEIQDACVSAPYVDYWNPWSKMNLEMFIPHPSARLRWFNGTSSLVFPVERDAVFLLPDHIFSPSTLDANLDALLRSGSQLLVDDYRDRNGATMDVYRWTDPWPLNQHLASISSAVVWASPEGPYIQGESEGQRQEQDLPLDFGHRLVLLGYTYDRPEAMRGEPWRLTTYWRVLDANSDPLNLFIHILDDANTVRVSWDRLDVSPQGWQVGDVFVQVHTLQLGPDLPVGVQRVELGVYSPVTMERLAPFTGHGEETAPHNRVLLSPLTVQ